MGSESTAGLKGPDFFIVGAPKCGTTAMANYLGQHPQIGMCAKKETQYLAGEEMWRRFATKERQRPFTRDEYMAMFEAAQGARRIGEASVWYLYSSEAPAEIMRFEPAADIIVMLRNPVEMLPSLHSQFVFVGIEPVEDFSEALSLDLEREQDGTPRGFPPDSYRAAARYSEQVQRYLDAFGPERVHVLIYEDFRDDTLGAYRSTCEFLGVDPEYVPHIEVVNANKEVKSRAMRRFVRRPPEPLRRAARVMSTQGMRRRAGMAMIRWNARQTKRQPVPEDVRDSLRPLALAEAAELERMLDVDLSSWRR